MLAVIDNKIYEGEYSFLMEAIEAAKRKEEMYDFGNLSDDEFTKTIRELYGPALNNRRQKEYWKDKVYISYVDGVDPYTVRIRYSNETLVYISNADWKEHHEELHKMTIEEVIREFALEVITNEDANK